jgi:hypothetical protein
MPHINLLYPFILPFSLEQTESKLGEKNTFNKDDILLQLKKTQIML